MNTKELTLKGAANLLWQNKFTFSGRASRDEYWLSLVAMMISFWILCVLVTIGVGMSVGVGYLSDDKSIILGMLGSTWLFMAIVYIAVLTVSMALNTRRLHDIGKSGWWQLLLLLPGIGGLILFFWMLAVSDEDNQYGVKP